MARKINGKEVAADIQEGMSDADLMTKYDLSPDQLKGVVNKLRSAGLLNGGFKCPSCGYPQPYEFDECPQCGVLVSKKMKKDMTPKNSSIVSKILSHKGWIIATTILVILSASSFLVFKFFKAKQVARVQAEKHRQFVEKANLPEDIEADLVGGGKDADAVRILYVKHKKELNDLTAYYQSACDKATSQVQLRQCQENLAILQYAWEQKLEEYRKAARAIKAHKIK